MRILFASTAGAGHFTPLVPWIEASIRRGHEVLVVGPAALSSTTAIAGYPTRIGDSPDPGVVGRVWAQVAAMKHADAAPLVVGEIFCRLNSGALLPAMRAACDEWTPDVVLRDPTEFASAVAAEERGITHVRIGHGLASGEAESLELSATALASFGAGLDRRIAQSTYTTLFPDLVDPSPFPSTRRYRLAAKVVHGSEMSDRSPPDSDPLVYATFGTVAPAMPGMTAVFHAVLDAVAGLPVRVVLSVGRVLDIAQLGPPPGNVQIERWVDQGEVMAHASLVVCHGGAGTTLGALAAGVPLVVFPLFADQASNARCVVQAGVGVAVEAHGEAASQRTIESSDAAALRDAIVHVLGDHPRFSRASAEVRSAMDAMPLLEAVYDEIIAPSPA